jgi:hypothetical protein
VEPKGVDTEDHELAFQPKRGLPFDEVDPVPGVVDELGAVKFSGVFPMHMHFWFCRLRSGGIALAHDGYSGKRRHKGDQKQILHSTSPWNCIFPRFDAWK